MINTSPMIPSTAMNPTNLPICDMGTRPMNIISTTTAKSRAAVERFSIPIRKVVGTSINKIYLKAGRSAPDSRCMALRICAVISTIVPLAISDGWKVKPSIEMTRLAPLML